jgi:hypothetical protein
LDTAIVNLTAIVVSKISGSDEFTPTYRNILMEVFVDLIQNRERLR